MYYSANILDFVLLTSSLSESGEKPQHGDPENHLTFCKINSIKKEKQNSTSI